MQIATTLWVTAPKPAPDGQHLFAIGDVHGHLAELQALRNWIFAATADAPKGSVSLVHLGDYIDRGPETLGVIDVLRQPVHHPATQVFLKGNHEQYLIELLTQGPHLDRGLVLGWLNGGGTQTLQSLGVSGYGRLAYANRLSELSELVATALGPDRKRFLVKQLQASHQIGDYLFVHAGIRPGRPLDEQDLFELLQMGEPFLSHAGAWPHSFCVVHGHSIAVPTVHPHRIGVDAGCYLHGALCAVQITGTTLRLIGATQRDNFDWEARLGGGPGGDANRWIWTRAG